MGILEEIANAIADGEADKPEILIKRALEQNVSPRDIIKKGLTAGVKTVGDRFERMEAYLPDMMIAANAMQTGIELLKPYLKDQPMLSEGVVVMATIQGDVHDIGKNIVGFYLSVTGFTVHDIGTEVPPMRIVELAEEKQADIIGISALMTSTMTYVPDVIDELRRRNIRDKYIVMVGGAAVTEEWVREIGADGYGDDFAMAERVAKQLIRERRGKK